MVFDLTNTKYFNQIRELKNLEEMKKTDRCFEIQYNKFFWLDNEDLSYDYYYWIDAGLSHCGLLPDKYLTHVDQYKGYYDNGLLNHILNYINGKINGKYHYVPSRYINNL